MGPIDWNRWDRWARLVGGRKPFPPRKGSYETQVSVYARRSCLYRRFCGEDRRYLDHSATDCRGNQVTTQRIPSSDESVTTDYEGTSPAGNSECVVSPFYGLPGSLNGLDSYEARRTLIDEANRWLHLADDGTDYLISTSEDHRALQPSHVVDVHSADDAAYMYSRDTVSTYWDDGTVSYDTIVIPPYDPTCMAVGGGSESTFRVGRGVLMSERPYRAARSDVRRTAVTTALGTVHGDRLYIGHVVVRRGTKRARYCSAVLMADAKRSGLPVGMRGNLADRLATLRTVVRSGATEAHDDGLVRLYCQTLNACLMPVRRITVTSINERIAKRKRDHAALVKRNREIAREFALLRAARQTTGLASSSSTVTPHAAYLSPLDRLRLAAVK